MKRVLEIFDSFEEAEEADLRQWLELSGDERLRIGEEMREEASDPDEPRLRRVLRAAQHPVD